MKEWFSNTDNDTILNEFNDNANSNDDSIELEPSNRDDKRLVDKIIKLLIVWLINVEIWIK